MRQISCIWQFQGQLLKMKEEDLRTEGPQLRTRYSAHTLHVVALFAVVCTFAHDGKQALYHLNDAAPFACAHSMHAVSACWNTRYSHMVVSRDGHAGSVYL
jgi:hypothetical protein